MSHAIITVFGNLVDILSKDPGMNMNVWLNEIHVTQNVNQFYFSVFCIGGNYANLGLAATKEG